jgi:hypothetical protein
VDGREGPDHGDGDGLLPQVRVIGKTEGRKRAGRYSLRPSEEAAKGAEKPTKKETHPVRKPSRGWNSSER